MQNPDTSFHRVRFGLLAYYALARKQSHYQRNIARLGAQTLYDSLPEERAFYAAVLEILSLCDP